MGASVKAVFDVKPGSGYDDDRAVHYHFPARRDYLGVAREAIGDWVLYREPQRNRGRRAYIAVARVVAVEPDSTRPDHAYARVADYLEFPTPVPFAVNSVYWEAPIRNITRPSVVGQFLQGKSMRPIAPEDFDRIVLAGLAETLREPDAAQPGIAFPPLDSLPAFSGMAEEVDRRVEQILLNRKVRDANFRLEVCRAYDNRCAVTGLRIINGGGRAEVQAAHVKPVAAGGPDIVQNGVALSATVHWLFDRHLISIDENYGLLISHNRVPGELRSLFRPEHQGLHLPSDRKLWPHPAFLQHHRERFAGLTH